MSKIFDVIDNYIYLYHTNTYILIPTYPESIQDQMQVSFNETTPLARSAPIYAYANSGPRSMQITLRLHREMMNQINYNKSTVPVQAGDDYVDTLIKCCQAMALPRYKASEKMVNPPIVAIRFGNDIFCKGIIEGSVGVQYDLPIIKNNKYAIVTVSFTIKEIDPFDADTVIQQGSYRGLNTSLERNVWKVGGSNRYSNTLLQL